jgi:hypothetical protein
MDDFPNVILGRTFIPASHADVNYNCIAWAVTSKVRPIWPDDRKILGWPEDKIPREETIASFVSFFELVGFTLCNDDRLEAGYEKIVLYVDTATGKVAHAARQLPNGRWTSKMAQALDAEHPTPQVLAGGLWQVSRFMKRVANGIPQLPELFPPRLLLLAP